MATDIVGGTTGSITASGFNGDVDGWSAQIQTNRATWRTFASAWRKSANVAYWMSGQFSGTLQFAESDTAPVPSATGGNIDESSFEGVSITLTADTGCTFTGTADITAVNVNRPATDRATGQWSFEFTDVPSITWDESA